MEQSQREKLYFVSILVAYTLLGIIGTYSATLIFLFPILAAPLTIFLMGNKINMRRDMLLHLIISLLLIVVTGTIEESLLYLIVVATPAHMVAYLYRKDMTIPQIMMYVGVSVIGVFYIYIVMMKFIGVDYVGQYMLAIDEYRNIQLQMIEEMTTVMGTQVNKEQIIRFKEVINTQLILLETIYPALFLTIGIVLAMIQLIIVTVIGRLKRWRMQPLNQLANFTFARGMGIFLIIALLLSQVTLGNSDKLMVLGINLFFFITSLLQILGSIVLIVMIRRKKCNFGIKIIAVISVLMLLFSFPTGLVIMGLLDTLFNFRKAKIIV